MECTWIRRIFCALWIYLSFGSCSSESSEPYPDSSVFNSQIPILNYRTKVLGVRYGQTIATPDPVLPSLIPRLTIKSYDEPKTEIHAPIYDEEEEDEGVTDHPSETSTSRIPTIPSGLRRNFAFITASTSTPSPSSLNTEDIKEKSSKTKSTRRRKVKRPPKPKSTTPKSPEDDLGNPESSSKSSTSSGDKNLALEIGSGDGKYALINNFFGNTTQSHPPGIISYAPSDDFGSDTKKTLGNVAENDIWLSEGHLLVLKGGDFDSTSRDKWEPIDAYERDKSKRPLRIPLDTENPPPFPVFINESGPPVFLGPPPLFLLPGYGEFNESFDPSRLPPPGLIPLFPNGTIPQFLGPPHGFNHGNNTRPPFFGPPPNGPRFPPSPPGGLYGNGGIGPRPGGVYGEGPPGNSYGNGYGRPGPGTNNNGSLPPPFFPFPPPGGFPNGTRLPPHPLFPFGPPGNGPPPGFNPNFTGGPFPFLPPLVLNPKDNETDDPSIFLPPPYDFDYYEDNSTIVPPGPFAPGLVVPPPKEFYSVYNKTSPIYIPTTTPYVSFKPQRPNAKKPKFPITNPPDDSIEADLPPTTPYSAITFPKKRKQGRGKSGKSYPKGSSEEFITNNERPFQSVPLGHESDILFKPRQVIPQTPKPVQNYVYVRGKLKTLAEIAGETAIDSGDPTPPPPFDEYGYPNHDYELEASPSPPVVQLQRPKKTKSRKVPPQIYFTSHEIHPTPFTIQNINNQPINPSLNSNSQYPPVVYSQNPRQQSPLDEPRNNNQYNNQDQHQVHVYPQNIYQNQGFLGPTYYTNNQNTQVQHNHQPQLFQPQPQQVQYNSQQEVNPNQGSFDPVSSPPTYTQFQQPTFHPVAEQPKKRHRSRIIFPDEDERQRKSRLQQQEQPISPQVYSDPILFQPQGYYSPISQYRTTLSGQFIPNNYYPNSGGGGGAYPGTFTTRFYHPAIQQQASPFFQQQQQYQQPQDYQQQQYELQQQYQQQPQNTYAIRKLPEQEGQVVPLHQDILVNYREPLPQYNSESETVTTRSVLKAGPSTSGIYGTQTKGEGSAVPVSQGTFYSFERGGPGGFSYKIRL